MIVVYVADKNYAEYVKISSESVKRFNPDARIILVSPEPVEGFENVVISLTREFRHNENDRITSATYLKLYLTQLPFDKIIYMDGDTLCQDSLDELWNMNPEYIAACETYSEKHKQDLGYNYALSGVMVMNLKNLRKINFTELCLSQTPKVKYWQHEETLINVALKDKINFIPIKWNYCHKREYKNPMIEEEAKILHICGKNKSAMFRQPFAEIKDVLKYIKGKTVAIVGNAQSIFDKNNGKEIDDHEIVIRFNRGFPNEPESQGTKTSIIILACEMTLDEKSSYKAMYSINRSRNTRCGNYTISDHDRALLKGRLGSQPSSGFMAIDMCLVAGVKSIDLYGFDGITPTYYNPEGYITQHNYTKEQEIIRGIEKISIH